MSSCIMDYPTAWAFVKKTKPKDHHPKCSWRTEKGALLCDCHIIWDEYNRRAEAMGRSKEKVKYNETLLESSGRP